MYAMLPAALLAVIGPEDPHHMVFEGGEAGHWHMLQLVSVKNRCSCLFRLWIGLYRVFMHWPVHCTIKGFPFMQFSMFCFSFLLVRFWLPLSLGRCLGNMRFCRFCSHRCDVHIEIKCLYYVFLMVGRHVGEFILMFLLLCRVFIF